jgi:inner membrane protein
MFLVHAPVSYLANEGLQKEKISTLKNSQKVFIAVLSLVFGILPDFDFLLLMMFDRPSYTHHDFFTHTPAYWIALWLLLVIIMKLVYPLFNRETKEFISKDFLNIILNTFLIAGLSHFFADLLVGNIMVFYPFSNEHFTLLRYIFEPSYFTGYFVSVYFAIEIIILAVFFWVFSKKFLIKQKWDDVVAVVLLVLTTLYLGFTVFINLKTYNNTFLEDANIPYMDYDMDYDTLRDIEDWDVDNDGVNNIEDAHIEKVVENVKSIIGSNKLAISNPTSLIEKIEYKYGALDSFRLVSQAYYEDYSPIEPVLKDFYLKNLDSKRYTVKFDHQNVLKDYFEFYEMLIDLNVNSNPLLEKGKIFFLLDENDEIMNMGITLEGNRVGIVLPGEKYVQYHTFDGIIRFYGDTISTFQIVR